MTREEAHQLVDKLFDLQQPDPDLGKTSESEEPKRELPKGKRLVYTKTSGDRRYQLDETKKTRQWVTNPEVLKQLGWKPEDAVEIEDSELLRYQMSAAIYRVEQNAQS